MKNLIITLITILILPLSVNAKSFPSQGRVTFHTFYYSLAPYGEWIEIDYGVYVWRPIRVSVGWSPYLIGRWIWTPYGWYWDSFEPFGWAVYHYGRWYYDDYYGWIWFPDYEWAPAWVEWRYSDLYIGWAPLPPYASFSISIGIRFTINWYSPYYYWHFVPIRYFCGYEVNQFVVGSKYKYRIYRDSRYSIDYRYDGGRVVNYGIDRNFISKKGGQVYEAKIEETTKLRDFTDRNYNERNRVLIYRPDSREINQGGDVKIRKSDRQISIDVSKIRTPRVSMDSRERYRNYERADRQKMEKKDMNASDREDEQRVKRNEDRQVGSENFEGRRKDNSKFRIENDRKQDIIQDRKVDQNFDFRRETNQRNFERPGIERSRDDYRKETEQSREIIKDENDRRIPYLNPQREEMRKRESEKTNSQEIERKRRH